ncbi:secretory lipase [Acidipila rosea]|uniref:Secretory lipase n=1 Tax=Acidipila rosea TaxID=768535 RepID=A0A4R1L0S8_9BACT|nr:secretory lipase [Acidipila rosea]
MLFIPLRIPFVAAALLFCMGIPSQSPAQTMHAFYVPPTPLPAGEHGKVIRSLPLTDAAALQSAARNLLVMYHSTSEDGKDVAVTGTVAIPAGDPPAGGWPVTTWTHGTTGIAPLCAPSLDTADGPEHQFLGMHEVVMDDYVKRGYVVVATDYEGLGPPGLHPFLQGASEAHGALDIIRAAREIDPRIGTRYVAIGHSQGGQADLFTAALGPAYVPELTLLGNIALAPASHIAATLQAMTRASTPSYALGYAMYVLESFASNHSNIELNKILTKQALHHLPETQHACITATVSKGYWATAIPKDQFLPGADLASVLKVAAENEPNGLEIRVPTLVAQGTADDTVMPSWTDDEVESLCKNGTPLEYVVQRGATHETVLTSSTAQMKTWVDARFAGKMAESNCSALPSAATPEK